MEDILYSHQNEVLTEQVIQEIIKETIDKQIEK